MTSSVVESDWPQVKITDFGFSKSRQHSACRSRVGTCAYMAPEVYKGCCGDDFYDGNKADIWSCGESLELQAHHVRSAGVQRCIVGINWWLEVALQLSEDC